MKKNLNNMEEIKIENINTIFELIRNNSGVTRVALSNLTSLTKMSITRIVNLLVEKDMVYEYGEVSSSRGRPAKKLHINSEAMYFFTAFIDVDSVIVAVLNLKNEIILKNVIEAGKLVTMEEYIDEIYFKYKDWEKDKPEIFSKIKCVAFVSPGIIDPFSGVIEISAQLGWRNAKIGEYANNKFGITAIVDNDVKTALLGEISSSEDKAESIIAHMSIGYGVGVGLWIDGKVLRGANNNAGEIGHISIDYNGQMCRCGRRGCLDTVLNINSFLRRANKYDKNINNITDIYNAYNKKEQWAIDLMDDASRYFSIAINNIIYSYSPNKIIVGGKLFELFPGILDIMISSEYFKTYSEYLNKIQIEPSNVGEDSYLIGGAINSQRYTFENILTFKN